jgi:hypothetical protein
MEVASSKIELASTFRWGLALIGSVLAGLIAFVLVMAAVALPAIIVVPIIEPTATTFMWFTIIGLAMAVLGPPNPEETSDFVKSVLEEYQDKNTREKQVFFISIFLLLMGAVSLLVGVVGLASALIASSPLTALIAIATSFLYPIIEVKLAQSVGLNIATIGGAITLLLLKGFAIAYQVSPDVPQDAAASIRSSINQQEEAL